MTLPEPPLRPTDPRLTDNQQAGGHAGHRGHGWLMIACCIPMLVVVGILLATGVVGFGFALLALACTALMAFMMRGMHGAGQDETADGRRTGTHPGH